MFSFKARYFARVGKGSISTHMTSKSSRPRGYVIPIIATSSVLALAGVVSNAVAVDTAQEKTKTEHSFSLQVQTSLHCSSSGNRFSLQAQLSLHTGMATPDTSAPSLLPVGPNSAVKHHPSEAT